MDHKESTKKAVKEEGKEKRWTHIGRTWKLGGKERKSETRERRRKGSSWGIEKVDGEKRKGRLIVGNL